MTENRATVVAAEIVEARDPADNLAGEGLRRVLPAFQAAHRLSAKRVIDPGPSRPGGVMLPEDDGEPLAELALVGLS